MILWDVAMVNFDYILTELRFGWTVMTRNNTLSLTNVVTSLVDFVTKRYKRLWRLCIIAGTSDAKKPKTILLQSYYPTVGLEI